MTNRNVIQEILLKKERLPLNQNRWKMVSGRLTRISQTIDLLFMLENLARSEDENVKEQFQSLFFPGLDIDELSGSVEEISRYVAVGLVACLEGYFRLVYADIMTLGNPNLDKLEKIVQNTKVDIRTALELEKQSITLGEYVGHMLPTSRLDDINRIMSALLNIDFLSAIKSGYQNFLRNQPQLSFFPLDDVDKVNRIMVDMNQVFEIRHINAHEIDPPTKDSDLGTVSRFADSTVEFILITEYLIKNYLPQNMNKSLSEN